jgi:polysaccharide biosynthesis transport protein
LPLLARIPPPPRGLRRRGEIAMLADSAGRSADPYRQLRVALAFANADVAAQIVLFSSPVEKSGKTTTVANLAVAFARAGRRVIAIDADLRRPALGGAFGLADGPGLTDVVLGHAPLDDVLRPVVAGPARAQPNLATDSPLDNGRPRISDPPSLLRVITGGTRVSEPSLVVESDAFEAVLVATRSEADLILLDSAPLLVASDTQTVAGMVDGIVLLLRASVVDRGAMSEATRLLGMLPARKLGFVLTGAEEERPSGYGTYGGGAVLAPPRKTAS